MARLNEPAAAPAAESIETLKRKFLRQNREIAKVNSTQAMRIRALENEVSRLLTDNLNSRGHIIRLERELESNRSRHQHVDDLRSQMEEKLAELGALFKDFDGRPSPKKRKSLSPKENGKMIKSTPAKSPGTKDWKNVCALGQAMPGHDGRYPPSLPAIMENKYYPRKTLELDDIVALKEAVDSTDSPELEPPPVSQFIDEDPVKIDFPANPPKTEVEAPRKSPTTTTFNTAMLEQRKKRRESVGITDIRRLSDNEAMIHEVTPDSLKVGAKRKISVRDGEDHSNNTQVSPDDFKFTRKTVEEAPASAVVVSNEKGPIKREIATVRARDKPKSNTTQISGRKALAPKPSNEDVSNSPRKKAKAPLSAADEISVAKRDLSKSTPLLDRPRPRVRPNKSENIPPKSVNPPAVPRVDILPDPEPVCEPETIPVPEKEPETPAAEELVSPIFSEPSIRQISTDTPPPTDIGKESASDHSRPGRRARSSVSYAEPNLRDKMRRPTKELIDAVTQKSTTYIKIEDGESSTISSSTKSSSRPVYIKPEPVDDDAWKTMGDPPSPLSNKAPPIPQTEKSNDIPADTRRNKSIIPKEPDTVSSRRAKIEKIEQPKLSRSAPGPPSTRHSRHQAISGSLDKDLSKLDISDGENDALEPKEQIRKYVLEESRNSKSRSGSSEDLSVGAGTGLARKNSSSKRNSALPLQMHLVEGSAGEESDVEGGAKKTLVGGRRRSVATVHSSSSSSVSDFRAGKKGVGPAEKEKEVGDVAGSGARQERINARRRSMVL